MFKKGGAYVIRKHHPGLNLHRKLFLISSKLGLLYINVSKSARGELPEFKPVPFYILMMAGI